MRTRFKSRKFMELKPNLVTMLNLLRIDILNCKSQLDIVDCSFEIVPLSFLVGMRTVHYLYNLLVIFIVFYEILQFCLNFLKFLERFFDFYFFIFFILKIGQFIYF